jgi:hypothetical protein
VKTVTAVLTTLALCLSPVGRCPAETPEGLAEHAPVRVQIIASDASSTLGDVTLGLPYADVTGWVGAGLVAIPPTCGVRPAVTATLVRRALPHGGWSEPTQEDPDRLDGVMRVGEPGIWRDLRVVSVTVRPRPSADVLVERMTVELVYEGVGPNPLTHWGRPISPEFERLYRGAVLNYDWLDVEPWSRSDAIRYLIIVADQLVQGGDSLAWWRNLTGMRAQVVSRSQIGGGSPAGKTAIKNYLQSAYNTWPQPPEFVVLMGDLGWPSSYSEEMPTHDQQDLLGSHWYASDHWYTLLDGSDYYSDVLIGRIPTRELSRCYYAVNKVVQYERSPLIDAGVTWQDKALMCAGWTYPPYPSIIDAKRFVAVKLLAYWLASVDSVYVPDMPGIDPDGMIAAAVNQGRGIVNYRGDPTGYDGWIPLGFYNSDISNYVHNGWRLPFVLSVSCDSGDYEDQTCFGEYWLTVPEANGTTKGAVAFFGSTGATHTLWNNWMDKGTFIGLCEDGISRATAATEYGKMWMLGQLGHTAGAENTFRQYGVLGDPGTLLWMDRPRSLQVTHPAFINTGSQAFTVSVKDYQGVPLNGALVCAWKGSEVYQYAYTMIAGSINLAVSPTTTGTMLVTVTARNMIPYEGQIQVTAGDVTPPMAISDLSISLSIQGYVLLDWSDVTQDATGAPETMDHYDVCRDTEAFLDPEAGPPPLVTLPYGTSSYVDSTAGVGQPSVNHFYCVVAVDQAGNRSAPSNRVGEIDFDSGR